MALTLLLMTDETVKLEKSTAFGLSVLLYHTVNFANYLSRDMYCVLSYVCKYRLLLYDSRNQIIPDKKTVRLGWVYVKFSFYSNAKQRCRPNQYFLKKYSHIFLQTPLFHLKKKPKYIQCCLNTSCFSRTLPK